MPALRLAVLLAVSACATGAPVGAGRIAMEGYEPFSPPAAAPRLLPEAPAGSTEWPERREARRQAVATARGLLGQRRLVVGAKRYQDDCTGLVRAAYDALGINLMSDADRGDNGVTAIYRFAQRHGRVFEAGRPMPGDLVLFRETYDRNRDGRPNDGLTHVALVEDVEADGTVLVIHRVARGVTRERMNLTHPSTRVGDDGRRWNDWLRPASPGLGAQLTGQLFVAYGTLLPAGPSAAPSLAVNRAEGD